MSTLKSNNEDMTINADGASSEIILQQNGTEIGRIGSGFAGTSGQVLTSNGAGAAPTMQAGGGITEADIFELTSSFSPGGSAYITANLSRSNDSGFGKLGTGMSESSGVFTFPSTGYWVINWIHVAQHSSNDGSNYVSLQYTSNNSSYANSGTPAWAGQRVSHDPTLSASSFHLLDITDTANQKVKFYCSSYNPTVLNAFNVMFLKIGET